MRTMKMGILACGVSAAAFAVAGPGDAAETITYSYDAHGQVTSAVHSGASSVQAAYTYDNAFNRAGVVVTGSTNSPPAGPIMGNLRAGPTSSTASDVADTDHSTDGPREGRIPQITQP